jgi:sporulation protein YlmC with PRC-barrel domain
MSESLYTWGGTYFGKRDGDSLFTHDGVEAGRFHGDEVFGADGAYLGELKNGKLITKLSRISARKSSFTPRHRGGHVPYVGHVGSVLYVGYEDFPDPENFR